MDYNDVIEYETKLLAKLCESKIEKKKILNKSEEEVQGQLSTAIKNINSNNNKKELYFLPQTPFSAFINFSNKENDIFWCCSRWYVDFLVVENATKKPYAVIEYFGSGHNINDGITEAKDNAKKKILQMAKIPLGIIHDNQGSIHNYNITKELTNFLKTAKEYHNSNGTGKYPNEIISSLSYC